MKKYSFGTLMRGGLAALALVAAAQAAELPERQDLLEISTPAALQRSIRHILDTRPEEEYPLGREYLAAAERFRAKMPEIRAGLARNDPAALATLEQFEQLKEDALLRDNPYLDFDEILLVVSDQMPRKANWLGTHVLSPKGYRSKIAALDFRGGSLRDIYQPPDGAYLGELDLHYEAGRLLFTSVDEQQRFQVMEVGVDGDGLRQVSTIAGDFVHNYGGIYLPSDKIVFSSTAPLIGVPCIGGGALVPNLYVMNAAGDDVRQLTFDQDASWYPTVTPDGKIMYLRWEYTDIMHYYSRIMMSMNPDGTNQRSIYGSQSLWPNSMLNARPLPDSAGRFVAIVSGHHGIAGTGKLTIFDTNKGHAHADGVVQHIPGYGRQLRHVTVEQLYPEVDPALLGQFPDLKEVVRGLVERHMPAVGEPGRDYHELLNEFYNKCYPRLRFIYPEMALDLDHLVNGVYPQFYQPYPLSDEYYLVLAQLGPKSPWGLYLVDIFDNMVPIGCELPPGYRYLLEPYPLRARKRPPLIPERINPESDTTTIYIQDIYSGPGLEGVPRGTVESLRLFTYDYAYYRVGNHHHLGVESSWDVKRVLGTVAVESDGSAMFQAPANTTISIQPLDAEGRAIQLFRSWLVGMPGENLSCVGCHEPPNEAPLGRATIASGKPPQAISPYRARAEGFSFPAEIQPILDAYCIDCHDGERKDIPDFKSTELLSGSPSYNFSRSYHAFHRYFRRPGPESSGLMLRPYEFHASTSEGVQLLEKGHHGVRLDEESWRRLHTWIDLNVPFYGSWKDVYRADEGRMNWLGRISKEAAALRESFASLDPDRNYSPTEPYPIERPAARVERPPSAPAPELVGWPFTPDQARELQRQAGEPLRRLIELGDGASIAMIRIPAGEFVMGSDEESPREQPRHIVRIDKAFWMSEREIDNELFFRFDPEHNPSYFDQQWKDHVRNGYSARYARQPAVHVSWLEAARFCEWISGKIGENARLPTEAQWEWACRAGSAAPFSFGALDGDFGEQANLADKSIERFAVSGVNPTFNPGLVGNPAFDFIPRDARSDDGNFLITGTAQYQPNAWGLYDMHGNVAEWTRSDYAAYPYDRQRSNSQDWQRRKVVRGGSFFDRPYRATASYRLGYQPWQGVFNVGFRIVIED